MCGIIGVTGPRAAPEVWDFLLEGLRRLEYRGYDSAGAVVVAGGVLARERAAEGTHSVDALAARLAGDAAAGPGEPAGPVGLDHAGLGHTRWATHGHPAAANAHPLVDCTGTVAVVHNGIIENHAPLVAQLAARGHTFTSSTDTEVVVHMVEEGLAAGLDLTDALRETLGQIDGAFALAAVHAGHPDRIVAARRVSPLVVGIGSTESFLASDIAALVGLTRDLYALEDDQIVELGPGKMAVWDLTGKPATPVRLMVSWDREAAEKGGFDDFMSKEMHEQPQCIADTLRDRVGPTGTLSLDESRLELADLAGVRKVVVVACGSSYHAALVAKYAIEHWTRLPTEVDIASEFRYRDPVCDATTLAVGVSQSGETVDTLQAMREARRWGAKVLVVSNVVDSSMAREADGVLYTRAGPEVGVAATKTHLAQIVALEILALTLAQVHGTLPALRIDEILQKMHRLPAAVDKALERQKDVDAVADQILGARDFFFLGRQVGYPVALEGALKLKELSYLRAEGYPAGELKHGPIALIEPGVVVLAVVTPTRAGDKMWANVAEVKSRGATVVVVARDGEQIPPGAADHVLWVPPVDSLLSPVVDAVPLQLLAYRLARLRGLDVDRPRNLAKTVTVE